jgi:outer membrane protein
MNMKKILFMFLGILPVVLSAGILTLDEAIDRAMRENPQVRASEFAMRKAKWDQVNAWTQLMPSLSASSRYMWIDDRTFAERDFRRYIPSEWGIEIPQTVYQESYYTSLDVTMPIFNSNILNGLNIAKASRKMAVEQYRSTRENTIYQVVSSYLNLLKSKELLKLQREQMALSKRNYEKAERLEKAGRYSRGEALRWKLDMQQQQSQVVGNEAMLRSQLAVLNRLLNTDISDANTLHVEVPDNLIRESEQLGGKTDEELLVMLDIEDCQMVRVNAALNASDQGRRTTQALYRGSYANYLPVVNASYSHAWRENNTLELDDYSPRTFLINVSVPLFTGFQNATRVKSAYYQYKQQEALFEDQIKSTRYLLTETVNRLISLKTQKALSVTSHELADHAYRVMDEQKEQGLVSNIDFIDARLNLQRAEQDMINTQYDFTIAMVELYYLLGKMEAMVNESEK